jgi:hypothetical protein
MPAIITNAAVNSVLLDSLDEEEALLGEFGLFEDELLSGKKNVVSGTKISSTSLSVSLVVGPSHIFLLLFAVVCLFPHYCKSSLDLNAWKA